MECPVCNTKMKYRQDLTGRWNWVCPNCQYVEYGDTPDLLGFSGDNYPGLYCICEKKEFEIPEGENPQPRCKNCGKPIKFDKNLIEWFDYKKWQFERNLTQNRKALIRKHLKDFEGKCITKDEILDMQIDLYFHNKKCKEKEEQSNGKGNC